MTSSVQVRETPLILSANREGMTGSWFSSGYFGHARSKPRMDLCDFYRQLARPVPPRKFLARQNSEATTHQFSQHDNRFKLENDPIIRATESGFGRRRSSTNRRGDFDPSFLSWSSKNSDENSSKMIFPSIVQSMPTTVLSTYVRDFHHGQPTNEQSKQIRHETFQRYSSTQTRRLRLQDEDRSPSVASCLVWNEKLTEKRPTTTTKETFLDALVPITSSQQQRRTSFHSQSMVNLPNSSSSSMEFPPIVSSESPMRSQKMTELVSKYL